ncbi:acyltransferase domain-containing protein [Streptomyces gobiensis]|uniref:acyltransferase domain-containing protein n=1 Tax=Streptomyces gobiensis TaxID=2875706 RepID=UPI001E3096E8|nr:acyltransferase domain-containing protein [Streptomyces gobiensis]UGY92580.1 acyltransferase domain-containing protein [Streptomyces gobiensis]
MSEPCVFLFPGQGAYCPGILGLLADPLVDETLDRIDQAAERLGRPPVSRLLLEKGSPTLDELVEESPPDLHLAIFAAEMVLFELLTRRCGLRPDVLAGHSFGELIALTAAGVFALEDGVALVAARDQALTEARPGAGGMVAVNVPAARARQLIGATGEWAVEIAADNGPGQCVLSGPRAALQRILKAAEALGLQATHLRVPYPFHNRMLAGSAWLFTERAARLPSHAPGYRVYSPILGRILEGTEDASELVAAHLTRPTGFHTALRELHAEGVRVFIECGPRGILTDLVSSAVVGVRTIAPLQYRVDMDSLFATIRDLRPDGAAAAVPAPPPAGGTPGEAEHRVGAVAVTPEETAPSDVSVLPEHDVLVAELREMYADALGYPPDVLTPLADLEADLGIDSLKQSGLLAQALERYGRKLPDSGERLTSYTTLSAVADFISGLPVVIDEDGGGDQ